MAETKKDRTKWVDAVTRMIELTQQGEICWNSVEPIGTVSEEENRTSAIFRTTYNDKTLRLYERKVPERRRAESNREPALFQFLEPKYQIVWAPEVILEFIDGNGATIWKFPQIGVLNDLLTAVQYQVAGVNDFLNDLFNETNAAA